MATSLQVLSCDAKAKVVQGAYHLDLQLPITGAPQQVFQVLCQQFQDPKPGAGWFLKANGVSSEIKSDNGQQQELEFLQTNPWKMWKWSGEFTVKMQAVLDKGQMMVTGKLIEPGFFTEYTFTMKVGQPAEASTKGKLPSGTQSILTCQVQCRMKNSPPPPFNQLLKGSLAKDTEASLRAMIDGSAAVFAFSEDDYSTAEAPEIST